MKRALRMTAAAGAAVLMLAACGGGSEPDGTPPEPEVTASATEPAVVPGVTLAPGVSVPAVPSRAPSGKGHWTPPGVPRSRS